MASFLAAQQMGVPLFLTIAGCLWPIGRRQKRSWLGITLRSWPYRDKLFLLNNSKAVGIWLLSSRELGDKSAVVICRQGK